MDEFDVDSKLELEQSLDEGFETENSDESSDSGDFDFDGEFGTDGWADEAADAVNKEQYEDDDFGIDLSSSNESSTESNSDFDIDALFNDEGSSNGSYVAEEVVVDVDLSKYEHLADSGEPVVLALVAGSTVVYLAHGTKGKLAPTITFLEGAIGAGLLQIPLGNEDIESLKQDARKFNDYYSKYVEGN